MGRSDKQVRSIMCLGMISSSDADRNRQSKTLAQATNVYKQRYGRNPPRGFDKWWEWAMENNVKIVDEVSPGSKCMS